MICPKCGQNIDDGNNFCPFCGMEFNEDEIENNFSHNLEKFREQEKNKLDLEIKLSSFNMGACVFGFIWGIHNGAARVTLLVSLFIFVLLGVFFYTGLLYSLFMIAWCLWLLGNEGNKWAWNGTKKWESYEQFKFNQDLWKERAKKFLPLIFVIITILIVGIIMYSRSDILNFQQVQQLIYDIKREFGM